MTKPSKLVIYLSVCIFATGLAFMVLALLDSTGAQAGQRCDYVVLKTQPRRIQAANLNNAASAGYRLVQETDRQTVLVKCYR